MSKPSRSDIEAAADRVQPFVRQTPCLALAPGELCSARVVLKLEQIQVTGSFKARGAFNALLQSGNLERGVIAASGGNHGIAVAYAARTLGAAAEIFVPEIASARKVARLQQLGAKVYQIGERYSDSLAAMKARQTQTGAIEIHAYDQPEVLAGQGTMTRNSSSRPVGWMLWLLR